MKGVSSLQERYTEIALLIFGLIVYLVCFIHAFLLCKCNVKKVKSFPKLENSKEEKKNKKGLME